MVHPAKGRFRSFLLASARNFLRNDWNRANRLMRGGGSEIFSIDAMAAEEWYRLEPIDDSSPEKLFDRRWAETLIEQVLKRLEVECKEAGQGTRFDVLRDFMLGGPTDLSYAEAGRAGIKRKRGHVGDSPAARKVSRISAIGDCANGRESFGS
jgi:RNA polymerase sigma-70 factor (ECF subfamily)